MEMQDEFLKIAEVAQQLRVTSKTVLNMIRDGRLKGVAISNGPRKHYRILKGELDRYVAEQYQKYLKIKEEI